MARTGQSTRLLALTVLSVVLSIPGCHKKSSENGIVRPTPTPSAADLWQQAALKVEEDRNEPVGVHAKVEVPEGLRHHSDHHRFLAVQAAEGQEQGYEIPSDFAGLVALIQKGQFVEMDPTGEDYVLFGVGGLVTEGPLTHYDRSSGQSVPLYASDAEYTRETGLLGDRIKELQQELSRLKHEIRLLKGKDRRARTRLQAQVTESERSVASATDRKTTIESYYQDPSRREILSSEYRALSGFAADFGGKSYDLTNPTDRREFKTRLLAVIRPEARAVIEEIAQGYKRAFDRPLPITSLLRTEEYQHDLREANPNAAQNSVPPHTIGLAFDIYYHYMNAAEQDFLMAEIASLKAAGRVEALRENRDHFHVFAFADGKAPPEVLIASSAAQLAGRNGLRTSSARRRESVNPGLTEPRTKAKLARRHPARARQAGSKST